MKKITRDELKYIQIEILNNVSEFCKANDINYWIDCGTLLGAVRHKGYIPWDDDIDIGMLREDYDKFTKLFNLTNTRYRFVCIENNSEFYMPYGKVCDTNTVLFEPDEQGYKLAVNIDVFVYDNAPDDDRIVERMFHKRDNLRRRFGIISYKGTMQGNIIVRILKNLRRYVYRRFFDRKIIEQMVENSKSYSNETTERVGNFSAFQRMVCHKRVFNDFIDMEFEGNLYRAPAGYDEWLTAFYGNYMKLPPVEKRVSHHSFVAYVKDKE